MRRLLLVIWAGGVLLLANWVQAPAAPSRSIAAPSAADVASAEQTAQSVDPVARQIDQEAERLRQRLSAQPPFVEPARDPFRFNGKKSEPKAASAAPKILENIEFKTPASPVIEVPTLIGLTEDVVDGAVTRTAVLTMGDDMAVVKIGQPFARFVVKSIGITSVELIDITSPARTVTTLSIR